MSTFANELRFLISGFYGAPSCQATTERFQERMKSNLIATVGIRMSVL